MKILILIFLFFYKLNFAYINIYPTEFNKDISNGATEKFMLYNRTDEDIKYRIYVTEGDGKDMSKWIEVYPQSILLKPLEEKEIRLSVTPPSSAEKGEYKAKLIIKEVEIPKKNKNKEEVKFMTIFKLNMKGYIDKNGNDVNE